MGLCSISGNKERISFPHPASEQLNPPANPAADRMAIPLELDGESESSLYSFGQSPPM